MLVALVLALSVDRHRRRDDEARGAASAGDESLQEGGSSHRVPADVAVDLVHGLPHAYCCGQVDDSVHADKGSIGDVAIADVAGDQRRVRGNPWFLSLVNLLLERIDNYHVVAASNKALDEVRADEAGTSGD